MPMAAKSVTVDAYVHHHWAHQDELLDYLSSGWRAFVGSADAIRKGVGAMPVLPGFPYHHPDGNYLPEAYRDRTPGSQIALLQEHLNACGVAKAVLSHDSAMLLPTLPNTYLATALIAAVNDWTIERWLGADP